MGNAGPRLLATAVTEARSGGGPSRVQTESAGKRIRSGAELDGAERWGRDMRVVPQFLTSPSQDVT